MVSVLAALNYEYLLALHQMLQRLLGSVAEGLCLQTCADASAATTSPPTPAL